MLEALVSSRIRRSLFEHLLSHPRDRFYLRGLAKELGLSVSPLRRELKRLEQAGMLRTVQEANLLYYFVNTASPTFLQLQHAGQQTEAPSASLETQRSSEFGVRSSEFETAAEPLRIPHSALRTSAVMSGFAVPIQRPALVAAAVMGMALVLIMASLAYLTVTNHRLVSRASPVVTTRKTEVTMMTPPPSASSTMRGARWQIVPGSFGGFSSPASQDSY